MAGQYLDVASIPSQQHYLDITKQNRRNVICSNLEDYIFFLVGIEHWTAQI